MFRYCCVLGFLLLFGDVYGDVSKNRIRRQDPAAQGGQLIDNIFNIPITAIRQTAAVAQAFSPQNTQTIDNVFKIPVATLEAVGTLVKTTTEQRQQNAENIERIRRDRREQLLALKEQKRKQKEELYNQRLLQQQMKRIIRHHKDSLGLNVLLGHHGTLGGHHPGLGGGIHAGHKILGGLLGHRPSHGYEVHEIIDEDPSFSWHGLTAGFGTFYGTRPSSSAIKIENKIAPKEQQQQKGHKYSSDDVTPQNKLTKIKSKPVRLNDDPPIENKIAPRNRKVTFF